MGSPTEDMGIQFSAQRWESVRDTYRSWWAKALERPLIQATVTGYPAKGREPKTAPISQSNCHDFSVSPGDIVGLWDYDLSSRRFLGDSFPIIDTSFLGPGVIAAFLGAHLDNSPGSVWFRPVRDLDIADIHWQREPDNPWFTRLREIYRTAVDYWGGQVLIGMTDLGGNLDILATFRPGERLLLDLLLHPDEVKRLTWDAHELWFQYFEELNRVLFPLNPGYSSWTPLYSELPYYMLQCDFSYMISPAQFDEFVRPEIEAACRRLPNTFYHLDGPGQLNHLDSLLEIEELDGVQWVPGAGNPDVDQWPDVYRRIVGAGKLCQVAWTGPLSLFDAVVDQVGTAKGLYYGFWAERSQEKEVLAFLDRYGVPANLE